MNELDRQRKMVLRERAERNGVAPNVAPPTAVAVVRCLAAQMRTPCSAFGAA